MLRTRRDGFGPAAVLTVALLCALVAAGGLGVASVADSPATGDGADAAGSADGVDGTDGSAAGDDEADDAPAGDSSADIEGETRVVTSEPMWEPAATPPAPGNDTVNSESA